MEPVLLSVIIVNWNTVSLLRRCLASLQGRLGAVATEVIVVDNASSDGSPEMVASQFPEVVLLRNARNRGFGSANNVGMAMARGEFLLLINSDTMLPDDSVLELVRLAQRELSIGVLGPRIESETGSLQPSAHRFLSLGRLLAEELFAYKLLTRDRRAELLLGGYWDHATQRDVDWVMGACMLVRRQVFAETGGFDPSIFLYGEEEEWCRRIWAGGWRIVFCPEARIVHVGHASADQLLGTAGRVKRGLEAADAMLERSQGPAARALGQCVKVVGALIKYPAFCLREAAGIGPAAKAGRQSAGIVLEYYWERSVRRLGLRSTPRGDGTGRGDGSTPP